MWRTYVICVLIGLLLVSTGGNVLLLRQTIVQQAGADRLQARMQAAESAQNRLQQQIDQLTLAAATPSAAPTSVPLPTVAAVLGPNRALLQQIEDEVAGLRGLQPKNEVRLQFLDQAALQRYFLDRFERDYLASEREADQKLLATLGLIASNENLPRTLLDILLEQVIGIYNEDDKVMYVVVDRSQFGPEEKTTFAHEYTHALQDQYFDLRRLSPKHPANDDQALAALAVSEGDAVLMQRLWAQLKMSQAEINQLGQNSSGTRMLSAPLFVREQLLFPYSDGFNFVRQIYQTRGGYPGVDELFRNPPDSTTQILHPEKYRNREKPIDVSLADLSLGSLGPGWRQLKANVLGELDLRLILEQLTDRPRAVRAASGWSGDRFALLEKEGRQALVIKSVWAGENEARSFFDAFGLAMRNRFGGAKEEEASATRLALTASNAATEVRLDGTYVLVVLSFDRPSAEAIAAAVSSG
jgi:hypothetical protein